MAITVGLIRCIGRQRRRAYGSYYESSERYHDDVARTFRSLADKMFGSSDPLVEEERRGKKRPYRK